MVGWYHLLLHLADARLTEEEKAAANTGVRADLDGTQRGLLCSRERKVPDLVSRTLHWLAEAGTTWLSGFALLIVVYYPAAERLLIPTCEK